MVMRLLLSTLPWMLAGGESGAQGEFSPVVAHTSWTTEEGLPQNSVSAISQDEEGYLWVATFGGLARFDGARFEVFDMVSRPDLPANRFLEVLAGSDGTLWVWAQEVGLFGFRDGRFTRFETPKLLHSLAEDAHGRLWGAFESGLFRIGEDHAEPVRQGRVETVLATSDGAIWASLDGGELLRVHDGIEEVRGPEDGLPARTALTLIEDREGILWAGCSDGIWRGVDSTNSTFERADRARSRVEAMAFDERGVLWISGGNRLARFDPVTGETRDFAEGDFDAFFADARGNLWIGGLGDGLHCVRYAPLHDAVAVFGIQSENAWGVTASPSGAVAVLYDREVVEVRGGAPSLNRYPFNVSAALYTRDEDLWVGRIGGLVRRHDGVETELGEDAGLRGVVRALLERADGSLWVGTSEGLFRGRGERFERVGPAELSGVRCVLEDPRSGVVWVGTETGLVRLDGDTLRGFGVSDGLVPGVVRALHLDEGGVLWIGSYGGGLARLERERFTRYTEGNGLADNYLSCILEDDDERLWINSNSGPFVVHRAELDRVARGESSRIACTSFAHEEGAREANGGNQPAGWRTADGRIWFPTIEGVTIADPAELPLDEAAPRPLIETLEVTERREFTARFTALGYSSPNRVRVQYRLLGQSPSWIECEGERLASYSYLAPGDYELEVRARNGYGPWSEVAARRFEVEDRFHETTAFRIGGILLVIFAAFGLAERRVKRSRERTAELVQLVEERERAERSLSRSQATLRRLSRELLTDQESERRRLSLELHDDVTQRIAALAIQIELAETRLEAKHDSAHEHLHELVLSAQRLAGDVQRLSRRLHPVGLRTLGLAEATRQECDAFTRRSGTEVDLEVDAAANEVSEGVAVAVFRILQESLHNVEKHAETQWLRVRVVLESGDLVLSITDGGRGFDPEAGAEAGLGLVTMRERAASVGGELSILSRSGEGTTVRLQVPGRSRAE